MLRQYFDRFDQCLVISFVFLVGECKYFGQRNPVGNRNIPLRGYDGMISGLYKPAARPR